jgi:2-oxoglutarate ferredoxin oxidoreductase subunit beta
MGFPYETVGAVEAAIRTKGFAFVEILAPCPTGHGKANQLGDAPANWDWYRKNTITRMDLAALPPEERARNRKIVVGTLWQEDKPEFIDSWNKLVRRLQSDGAASE